MGWTNTTLIRYSEFHAGGYPTIFSQIWLTNRNLQYNGFLQYNWCQSLLSYLESVYLFWCLDFDISKCLYMMSLNNEGSQFSKFHFPCSKEERLVFNSFFREYNLYFKKFESCLRWLIIQSAVCHIATHPFSCLASYFLRR